MKKDNTKMRLMTLLVGFLLSLPVLSAAGASEYYPMLVEGRTWKYSEFRFDSELPGLIVYEKPYSFGVSEFKIKGDSIVDGVTYKKIYVYYDKSTEPYKAKPRYLLREVESEKSVYLYRQTEPVGEVKIYDFSDMACVDMEYWWCFEGFFTNLVPTSMDLLNGQKVNGFISEDGRMEFYEGIGWFDRSQYGIWGDLTGADDIQCVAGPFMRHHEPCLYSVCEADGSEIFAIEEHRPEVMGLEAIRAEGADNKAAAVYYRFDGVRFDRRPTEPGIYIRVSGAEVSKVVI